MTTIAEVKGNGPRLQTSSLESPSGPHAYDYKGVFLHCLPDPIRLDSRLYTPLDASRDGIDTTARFELSSRLAARPRVTLSRTIKRYKKKLSKNLIEMTMNDNNN